MELRTLESDPSELLEAALQIVSQLQLAAGNVTVRPLVHHPSALAAFALLDLTGYPETKDQAESALKVLLDGHIAPSNWNSAIREMIVKKQQSNLAAAAISAASKAADSQHGPQNQSLISLAEAAVAGESGKESEKGLRFQRYHSMRGIVRNGYLSALEGDISR